MPDKQIAGLTPQTLFPAIPEVNTIMAILSDRAYGNVQLAGSLGFTLATLTISGGAINIDRTLGGRSATYGFIEVDTEAAAASDDLDTITGGRAGMVLYIVAVNTARTIVAKDGTGNLQLQADFSLDSDQDVLQVIKRGSNWLEISRADNG